MGLLKEFREFAAKGNVIDLAVGVVIGGAFGKIVSSFVGDIIMPLVNTVIPNGNWRTYEVGPGVKLGSFMGSVLDFLIVAFAIFMMVKAINRMKRKEEAAPAPAAEPTRQEVLLMEIRDLLKTR
jgi:large conductance mechanosensitive channel